MINTRDDFSVPLQPILSSSCRPAPTQSAYADTGATDHFFSASTVLVNKQPTTCPVQVSMANGSTTVSTHTAQLPHKSLPVSLRSGHVLPHLTTPLLSIGKFCDAGCRATFDSTSVTIRHNDTTLLSGTRTPNGLWSIPIPIKNVAPEFRLSPQVAHPILPPQLHQANFTIHDANIKQAIKYLHLSLFSPTKATLLRAIRNNHFVGWPCLSSAIHVQKHLRLEEPTIMGHMDQQRKNTRSTQRSTQRMPVPVAPTNDTITPPNDEPEHFLAPDGFTPVASTGRTHEVFLSVQDTPTGMVYTDQTGPFPITSSRGIKAVMLLYDYDSNAILVEGISSRGQSELLRAYQTLHGRLVHAGLRPKMQRLDNEASLLYKKFLQSQGIDFQLTPASVHRRNAAERAIRTWKNHFISGLSSMNPRFPLMYWCQLLPQSELTLNLLRQSRLNPRLSVGSLSPSHDLQEKSSTRMVPRLESYSTGGCGVTLVSWERFCPRDRSDPNRDEQASH